ncbi:MAG: hypothetical protein QM697_18860 [Lachnospiraceae bacterium]
MEVGFVEQQAKNLVKRKWKTGITSVLVSLPFVLLGIYMYFASDSEYAAVTVSIFVLPAVVMLLCAIPQFLSASKIEKDIDDYTHLKIVLDTKAESSNANKRAAVKIINDEIAHGKTQIELPWFKVIKDSKIILIPSYLLFCKFDIIALPTDKIYWIYAVEVNGSTYINNRVVAMKGYVTQIICGDQRYYIDAKNKTEAEKTVAQLHKYIPDVLGEYDRELEKLFDKNHEEFLKIYNQKKEKYSQQNI